MIDPLVSLAFSIQANRGVYALLLGSGVSRSAQIPTGWEIVLDLIRKLAKLEGVDCEPDPAAWYKEKFGEYPDYSKLLSQVVNSAPERRELLRPYFEPTEEEREEGLKLSTEAHQAIANLVSSGYIRVIITTNFDRLLENALGNRGIAPIVITTGEAAIGVLPLITHSTGCIIVKVNGDYLEPQTRNTTDELKRYSEHIQRLLDRIFDEFGLIVCGWSGDSDIALRAALEGCSNHRFTTYWMDIREPTGDTSNLINLRRGKFIRIQNADKFFGELAENVFALEKYSKPHPLDTPVLAYRVKKYLRDDRCDIRLHDLANQEVEKLYANLSDEGKFPISNGPHDEFRRQVEHYEDLTEPLLAMMITGCRWGKTSHENLWINCIERIADISGESLTLYPAHILLYGGGIASIAAENYSLFSGLLNKPVVGGRNNEEPLIISLAPDSYRENYKGVFAERGHTPLSYHLYNLLRDPFKELIHVENRQYQECFDRFEYLFALVHANLKKERGQNVWGPIGCFGWRNRSHPEKTMKHKIELEFEKSILRRYNNFQNSPDEDGTEVSTWPLLKAGLFGGNVMEFRAIKKELDKYIENVTRGWM